MPIKPVINAQRVSFNVITVAFNNYQFKNLLNFIRTNSILVLGFIPCGFFYIYINY